MRYVWQTAIYAPGDHPAAAGVVRIYCAIVDAASEAAAQAAVQAAGWTPLVWRFCDRKPPGWEPGGDRFPRLGGT